LQAINETEVESMLAAIRGMWQRFTYHYAVKQEAKRQKLSRNIENAWASAYNSLTGDDAFSTFIQVRIFLKLISRRLISAILMV
jgi:hypothetical protein